MPVCRWTGARLGCCVTVGTLVIGYNCWRGGGDVEMWVCCGGEYRKGEVL